MNKDILLYETFQKEGMPEKDMYFYLRHPKMPCGKRAKIFAPFAALKGFDEEVASKEISYVEKMELSEEECRKINDCLIRLRTILKSPRRAEKREVIAKVTFYRPCEDEHHPCCGIRGTYETVTETVKEVNPFQGMLVLENSRIPFADLSGMELIDGQNQN